MLCASVCQLLLHVAENSVGIVFILFQQHISHRPEKVSNWRKLWFSPLLKTVGYFWWGGVMTTLTI